MKQLNERVAAAGQLGYDVEIRSTSNGLEMWYKQRIDIPIEWKYL